MATTVGEIDAMFRRLDALLAQQSLREADVAFIAAAPAEARPSWLEKKWQTVRGLAVRTVSGRPESVRDLRARKRAELERSQQMAGF